MKATLRSTKKKKFSPVTVTLEIATIKELRLLLLIFNTKALATRIKKIPPPLGVQSNKPCEESFHDPIFRSEIIQEIQNQGFDV